MDQQGSFLLGAVRAAGLVPPVTPEAPGLVPPTLPAGDFVRDAEAKLDSAREALTRRESEAEARHAEAFREIRSLDLAAVRTPTLLVHGDADGDVDPEHSRYAAEQVPGAELLVLETGTHLALWTHPDADAAQARVLDLLLGR